MEEGWQPLEIGRGEQLTHGDDLLIVAYGSMVHPALATAGLLQERGLRAAVVNGRFLRPLDEALILPLARRIGRVVTMEEGALAGGFGGAVVEALNDNDVHVPVLRLGIPDVLVDHASPDQSKERLGLTPPQMAERIVERFGLASGLPIRPVLATG
jgi:1-deoxy-D-xylulose-5-phosphate synthase